MKLTDVTPTWGTAYGRAVWAIGEDLRMVAAPHPLVRAVRAARRSPEGDV